jgi:hypothetical protein
VIRSALCLALCALAGSALALPLERLELELGSSSMIQNFEYDGPQIEDPELRLVRAVAGITAVWDLPALEGLELRTGASYIAYGYRFEWEPTDEQGNSLGTMEGSVRADVLSLAALGQWQPSLSGPLVPFLRLGPTLDILVRQSEYGKNDDYKSLNLGLRAGAGLRYGSWSLALDYQRDLGNPYDKPSNATLDRITNQGTLIQLGYDLLPLLRGK